MSRQHFLAAGKNGKINLVGGPDKARSGEWGG